ncbi:MAG: AMP-binding protein [Planctomycetes bacterium]|nr:AMP-binding protein [Planctomycetota bacterium]
MPDALMTPGPLDAAGPGAIPADTLSGLLREAARRLPSHEALACPAFTQGGEALRLTFAQLDARVDDLAWGLLALGLEPGEHVALWAPNVPDWVPLEFALARVGVVLVTANTALKRQELGYLLKQSRSVAVLHVTRTGHNEASAELDELFAAGDAAVSHVRHRLWLRAQPDDEPPLGLHPGGGKAVLQDLDTLVERGRHLRAGQPDLLERREAAVRPGDVANIQYTSGTTGFPKGVMLTHRNLLHSGYALGGLLGTVPEDRLAAIVPMFHCFGCVVCVLGAFGYGATLCLLPWFEPGEALRLVEEERCTLIHGVPTMFSAMLAHADCGHRATGTLRAGLIAGAPVPAPLVHAIHEHLTCAGMAVTYGLTEAAPGVSGSLPDAPVAARAETIGKPLPGVEARVCDPATLLELPAGQRGELLVRGPNVMAGYHDDPEATARVLTPDGWLRTGDLCFTGPDGRLRIAGRLKDIIIRGGENIMPSEIENALRELPQVLDAAVVGVPSERLGEEVGAALQLREGCALDPAALHAALQQRLASFKIPAHWLAVDHFPLTGSGKVQKYRIREWFARAEGTA